MTKPTATQEKLTNLYNQIINNNVPAIPSKLMSKVVEITHRTPLYKFHLPFDERIVFKDAINLLFTDVEASIYFNRLKSRIPESDGFFVVKYLYDTSKPKYRFIGKQVRKLEMKDVKRTILIQKFVIED